MSTSPIVQELESAFLKKEVPDFRPGDSVRVHTLIKEGEKERVQVFEGVVIGRKRGGVRSSFTVRKMSYGIGVERVFPLHSSRIERIEVIVRGRVRRARLNYLRGLEGKAARIKGEYVGGGGASATPAPAAAPAEAEAPAASE